jgi:hypothetical protein
LYFARPFAVKPAPLLTGSFSPLPTERFGPFLRLVVATDTLPIYTFAYGLIAVWVHSLKTIQLALHFLQFTTHTVDFLLNDIFILRHGELPSIGNHNCCTYATWTQK